jgi:release factor glutamine methyltransferase
MAGRPGPRRSVSQAIAWCVTELAEAGVENTRLEAELLLEAAMARGRQWLFLHPDEGLTVQQQAHLSALLARRARREPLPYVLGRAEFYGLAFRVTPAAIVPRPETEILVEAAAARARATSAHLIADVGTGCGAIAVALSLQLPGLRVLALDLSLDALRLAGENCQRHRASDRVALICTDLLGAIHGQCDAVVANLPYVRSDEFARLQPEVRDCEPRLALDGGPDGLGVIRRLCVQLPQHLRPGGFAALEVGTGQAREVEKLLAAGGLEETEVVADYAGIERVVIGWSKG